MTSKSMNGRKSKDTRQAADAFVAQHKAAFTEHCQNVHRAKNVRGRYQHGRVNPRRLAKKITLAGVHPSFT